MYVISTGFTNKRKRKRTTNFVSISFANNLSMNKYPVGKYPVMAMRKGDYTWERMITISRRGLEHNVCM